MRIKFVPMFILTVLLAFFFLSLTSWAKDDSQTIVLNKLHGDFDQHISKVSIPQSQEWAEEFILNVAVTGNGRNQILQTFSLTRGTTCLETMTNSAMTDIPISPNSGGLVLKFPSVSSISFTSIEQRSPEFVLLC